MPLPKTFVQSKMQTACLRLMSHVIVGAWAT